MNPHAMGSHYLCNFQIHNELYIIPRDYVFMHARCNRYRPVDRGPYMYHQLPIAPYWIISSADHAFPNMRLRCFSVRFAVIALAYSVLIDCQINWSRIRCSRFFDVFDSVTPIRRAHRMKLFSVLHTTGSLTRYMVSW